jgi:hypothetical protein
LVRLSPQSGIKCSDRYILYLPLVRITSAKIGATPKADVIAEHACKKYSGRVGRSSGAKGFEQKPIELAVRAHIRHEHTNYDELLMMGWDRYDARQEIIDKLEQVIEEWQILPPNIINK